MQSVGAADLGKAGGRSPALGRPARLLLVLLVWKLQLQLRQRLRVRLAGGAGLQQRRLQLVRTGRRERNAGSRPRLQEGAWGRSPPDGRRRLGSRKLLHAQAAAGRGVLGEG